MCPQTAFRKTKRLLSFATALLLAGCATTIRPTDTLRWRGKDISDFVAERAHRIPDIVRRNCVKNNEVRNLYAWRIDLYEIRQAYVGQSGNVHYYQNYRHYNDYEYRIVVTKPDGTILSVRDTAFGNADKEYGCEEYREELKPQNRPQAADRARTTRGAANQANTPAKPRVWRAIAMSENNTEVIYPSAAHPTEEAAKADALRQCQRASGNQCGVWQRFSNMCFGMSVGQKNGRLTHFPSVSLDARHADYAAIQNCRSRGGTQCDLFKHSICALPCDITKNGCYFEQPLLGSYGHFNNQVKPVGLDQPDEKPDESILRIIMRHPR